MFNKITIVGVILIVGLGAFWFFYYEQGANQPIAIEATITASGTGIPMAVNGAELNLYATPKKLKINLEVDKEKVDFILRLDKDIMFIIDHSKRKYAEIEFKYVDKDKVKSPSDASFKWEDKFDIKVDAKYIGEGSDKIFCRKFSLKNNPAKVDIWLTRDIKIGRSYIKAVNKLLKIDPVNKQNKSIGGGGKRPQIGSQNMEYFPVKLDVSMSERGQSINVKLEAKKVSRKSIPKSEFEVPSGFSKVEFEDLLQQMAQQAQKQMQTRPQPRRR